MVTVFKVQDLVKHKLVWVQISGCMHVIPTMALCLNIVSNGDCPTVTLFPKQLLNSNVCAEKLLALNIDISRYLQSI